MSDTPRNISEETLALFKALSEMECAKLHLHVLLRSPNIDSKTRGWIDRNCNGPLGTILKKIYKRTPQYAEMLKDEVGDPEVFLRFDSMKSMFMALPPGKQDEIERYTEAQYNIYRLNKKK